MHLTEADILLLLEKKLTTNEREKLESHLADCETCVSQLKEIALLRQEIAKMPSMRIPKSVLRKAEGLVQDPMSSRATRSAVTRRLALGGAALAGAVLLLFLVRDTTEISRFRSPDTIAVPRLLSPSDGSVYQPEYPFRWQALPEAIGYRFTLYNHAGLPLWEDVVPETTIVLPQTIDVKRGEHYFWRVEYLFPDQSTMRSHVQAFTYTR